MFKNQGTSLPVASQYVNGDRASEWEELVELDDVQLATVVGGGLSAGFTATVVTDVDDRGFLNNVFDLLLGTPAPVIIAGQISQPISYSYKTDVQYPPILMW